jgi:hypothetical protein
LNSPYLYGVWPLIADRAGITMLKGKKGKKATATTTDGDGEDEAASASVDRQSSPGPYSTTIRIPCCTECFEKITGLARLTRAVSGFVEAHEVALVASGGVKNDRIDPSGKAYKGEKSGAEGGFGNVPYARTEYTAKRIVASFAIDTSLVRSYGLGDAAERLLLALALWKIANLLKTGCDYARRAISSSSRTALK